MNEKYQPIFILPEGTDRSSGKNAQNININAAILVADTVRTTLGPKGMDKMLVDSLGQIIVTNDGVTILNEINFDHPTAKMVVEIAKTQEKEIGDGTTTAVIIAGELLKKSELLLSQNIHPTILAKGYRLASEKALNSLNKIAKKISFDDDKTLNNIAITAMTGKGAEYTKSKLAEITVKAVKQISEIKNDHIEIDISNIKLEKIIEGSVDDTELIEGIVIDKEKTHPTMPKKIKNSKILLLDSSIEIKSTEIDSKIQINNPSEIQAYLDQEENLIKSLVNKIISSGANVVLCQKGIDDLAQYLLAKNGIYAVRRVKRSDLDNLSKATGARIISNLNDLNKEDLGYAGLVEEVKSGDEYLTYIKDCKNPKALTILIRGSSEHIVDEIKRAIEDAIGDVASTIKQKLIVGGAGSIEIEICKILNKFADTLSGREQLVVKAFAESLEIVPRTLAENAGLDPIDVITSLKSSHEKGLIWSGIDVFSGNIINTLDEGIIEPLKIKTQAITSATEVAIMILRIDDIISSEKKDQEQYNMPE
ncbi:MAG: thermosome subunit beta [Candidatus Woesearchaeota archaeon]